MGKVEQETLNIMNEETLKNKEKLISEKFSHFFIGDVKNCRFHS
jgi:hypothetical protein